MAEGAEISYVQGMNVLLGPLLYVMPEVGVLLVRACVLSLV